MSVINLKVIFVFIFICMFQEIVFAADCKVGSCPCSATGCPNGSKWNCNPFGGCLCSYVPLGACLWTSGVCCTSSG
uniref:Uncharacterized protein n=1 Tax=Meloidogyne enterolobii TaxID=390850 RepID=A0A6V7XE01_MELEN|nr:unnamed protein product [Meloidogyne enterolobii]